MNSTSPSNASAISRRRTSTRAASKLATTPANSQTPPTKLTPELVCAVLAALNRFDDGHHELIQRELQGGGFGLLAASEAVLAVERARSVLPVINAMFAAMPCRRPEDAPTLRFIRETIAALPRGAAWRSNEHEDVVQHEELADYLTQTPGGEDVRAAGEVAGWMVTMLRYSPDAGGPLTHWGPACTSEAAVALGNHLAEHRGLEAFDAFIAALRAIPAAAT